MNIFLKRRGYNASKGVRMTTIAAIREALPGVRFILTTDIPFNLYRGHTILLVCPNGDKVREYMESIRAKSAFLLQIMSAEPGITFNISTGEMDLHASSGRLLSAIIEDTKSDEWKDMVKGQGINMVAVVHR